MESPATMTMRGDPPPPARSEENVTRPETVWIDGDLIDPASGAPGGAVSVLDHGLLYGDGVFEGIRYYGGTAFRLDAHLDRLARSATALRLQLPFSRAALVAAIDAVIAARRTGDGNDDGYLRLIVTRGRGTLGLDPASCPRASVIVIAGTVALFSSSAARGIAVITSAVRQPGPDVLDPRIKTLNYLPRVMARLQATAAGADEAILLNGRGLVTEGTTDNVFAVSSAGVLCTPPVVDGALDGITRQVVLELAASAGIPTAVTSLAPYDLQTAGELFLTGTAAELIPVRSLDGQPLPLCPGPVFSRLAADFQALVRAG